MEQLFHDVISGRARGAGPDLARLALTVASWGFALGARLRRRAFDSGWRRPTRATIPIISLGNLTTGGTGKTPMVAAIARRLAARGRIVAILSRGYRAPLPGAPNDEGLLLATLAPEALLYQHPDRAESARRAASDGATVAILDDGFQHRCLHRDVDIVLVDATNPFGYDALLPRGLLREPPSSLRRAHAVLITRAELIPALALEALSARLVSYGAPRPLSVAFQPQALRRISGVGPLLDLAALRGRPIEAACGIGNPEAFRATLELGLGARVLTLHRFPDHHPYTAPEVRDLLRSNSAAEALIVTEKDAVKLTPLIASIPPPHRPIYALAIAPVSPPALDVLIDAALPQRTP